MTVIETMKQMSESLNDKDKREAEERIVEEYYGQESLKEIFTQILKQEFIKDCEEKTLKG